MTELNEVETEDGLRLHGLFCSLEESQGTRVKSRLPCTHFLLVHGTSANFYHPGILARFAESALQAGFSAWRVNTRGHDGIATIPSRSGGIGGGATYEVISDCVSDLAAWIGAMRQKGAERIVLVGHSMGAVKSIYYAAKKRPNDVDAVIALSPPRFCHSVWMTHPKSEAFRRSWSEAQLHLREGRPDILMPVTQPVRFVATPEGFAAKYGPHDDYDVMRKLPETECPTLVLLGSVSVSSSPAFEGQPEELAKLAPALPHLRWELIDGADISYRGSEEIVMERSFAWLRLVFRDF